MQKVYSIQELVEFAVQIEVQGAAFYLKLAAQVKDPESAKLYSFLSEEELRHQQIYEAMLQEVSDSAPEAAYSDEYHQYLKAIVENIVFSSKQIFGGDKVVTDLEAVDYAVGKEKDSILFYIEMKKFVPKAQHNIIDEIIEEEQLHILKLVDIKEKIS